MSKPRSTRNLKQPASVGTSAGPGSRERLDSRVTVLAIERALAELGVHARLSEIIAKAHSIEHGIMQARSRRRPEQTC